jgi:hypothetical protein
MRERKGRVKKKAKDIRIAVDICKTCRKSENNFIVWNEHDDLLWKNYKYVRCAIIRVNDLNGAPGPAFLDGTQAAPDKCPYAMEHLILCKKNCTP